MTNQIKISFKRCNKNLNSRFHASRDRRDTSHSHRILTLDYRHSEVIATSSPHLKNTNKEEKYIESFPKLFEQEEGEECEEVVFARTEINQSVRSLGLLVKTHRY